MSRRQAVGRLLAAGGAAALGPLLNACATAGHRGGPVAAASVPGGRAAPSARVDDSFARLLLGLVTRESPEVAERLLQHPALTAVLRHQQLTGNAEATRRSVLEQMVTSTRRSGPTASALDAWAGRHGELIEYAAAAAPFLPAQWRFGGTIYLIMGYDIGIPAPPGIVLNAGHPHIVRDPRELGFYATHEAHHVGFYAVRPMPVLERLNEAPRLLEIVRYFTQLEGMAVHAAYPVRAARDALAGDGDYLLYYDSAEAKRVTARYAEVLGRVTAATTLADADVGDFVEAMTTRERLWYRFGALVAQRLEKRYGRAALVASIAEPAVFLATASEMLGRDI